MNYTIPNFNEMYLLHMLLSLDDAILRKIDVLRTMAHLLVTCLLWVIN